MGPVAMACYAFVAGLTVSGLAGSALELLIGRHVSFAEPFVSRGHVYRSLAVAAVVGPFMLCNDAVEGWKRRQVSAAVFGTCLLTAAAWVLATGVLALGLAVELADLLS